MANPQLIITYDPETDVVNLGGPLEVVSDKNLVYAMLERAKDVARNFKPKPATPEIVRVNGDLGLLNRFGR